MPLRITANQGLRDHQTEVKLQAVLMRAVEQKAKSTSTVCMYSIYTHYRLARPLNNRTSLLAGSTMVRGMSAGRFR